MTGQVGPRGLTILVIAGLIGLALAITGWSQRGTGLVAPSVGGLGGSAPIRTSAPPPLPPARFYAGGGKVYILESNLGDDSGNLGDNALIVTNLEGRIVP